MQSALAIIPFPLATAETPPPGAESTDQGFALAFDEGLVVPEGEIPAPEPTAVAQVMPPFWVGPVLSLAAVVPSDMEEGVKAYHLDAGSVVIPDADAAAPDLSREDAAPGVPDPGAEERPALPKVAMPAAPEEGASPRPPGSIIEDRARLTTDDALQPDPPLDAKPDQVPAGSGPTEKLAPLAPLQHMTKAAPEAAPGTTSVASDTTAATTVPERVVARVVEGNPAEMVARIAFEEPEGSDRIDKTKEDQIAPAIVDRLARIEASPADPGPIGLEIERADQATRAKIEVDASPDPEPAQTSRLSIADDYVERRSEPAFALLPREPLAPQTQPASFWERFFAGLTAPRSVAGQRADHEASPDPLAIPSDDVVAATAAVLPLETSVKPISLPTVGLPPDRPRMVALSERPAKDPSPRDSVAPPPLPERQTGTMPPTLMSEWDKGLLEGREQLDLALLSGAVLQSGSSFSASSGPQIPMSLPVQQVAEQLAAVLVDVSDKVTELALAPEELGRVSLRLEPDAANPDRMTILINVERPETLDLFRRHAGELADAIKAAGYSGADIGFGQQGQGSSPDHSPKGNAPGSGRPAEDQAPVSPARRDVVGATLDLRL